MSRVFIAFRVLIVWFLCATASQAETVNWGIAPQSNLLAVGGDPNRPSAPVGVTVTTTGINTGNLTGVALDVVNGTPTGSPNAGVIRMQMDPPAGVSNGSQTVRMTFSEPVYNLTFSVSDIDGGPTYNGFNDFVYFRSSAGFPTTAVPTSAARVVYSAALGRANPNPTSNINVVDGTGDITVTFAGPVSWVEVQHENGADVDSDSSNQWVFINDLTFRRAAQVRVAKSTSVGGGTFDFSTSNAGAGTTNTSVTAATVAVNSPFVRLNTMNTLTTVTEVGGAGWLINNGNVTCADSNSAVSGNPTTFNAVVTVNKVITLAATNIRSGALITCTIVNQRRPTVQIVKNSQGATGSFDFTGNNGFPATNILTSATNTATLGVVRTLAAAATATNISETVLAGWQVNGTPTCTVNGAAAAITWTAATQTIGLTAAQTAASNAIVCTFINRRLPRVTVNKATLGGFGGPFTFTQTGLAAINNISTIAVNTPTPSTSGTLIGTVGGATSVTEGAMPSAAWLFGSVACTDNNAALSGNPASVGTVAGQAVTLTAAMVAGADIVCTFVNGIRPTVRVSKITLGNAAASPNFTFTQTNLATVPGPLATTGNNVANTTAAINVVNRAVDVTVTEGITAGYTLAGATCADANSAVTLNPANFGTLAGSQITIPASNLAFGAQINCTFTNNRNATMQVRKTTVGGVNGPFTFTQSNLSANPSNVTTTFAGTPASGTPTTVDVASLTQPITVTEGAFTGYMIGGASCTDSNSVITGNSGTFGTLVGLQLTVPVGFVKPGAQFVCTFSNTLIVPQLTMTKTSTPAGPKSVGNVVTYNFTVVNSGNVPMSNVFVTETAFNGYGTPPVPGNEVIVTDVAPFGDSSDGGVNGTWTTLGPGDTIRFTANYMVVQGDVDFNYP